jgi:Zn-dependent protease with chaperone function
MMMKTTRMPSLLLASAMALATPIGASAQTRRATPGFNLFTVEQDVEIGRQSAVEAEKQLRLLNQPNVNRYLTSIISRLAAQAPDPRYPYTIKAVNDASINAFALPGGPMYVNRGLFEAARNEAELAGVLAHEMSHVVLRHGTHQASKAYLSQSGLGILGGLLGKSGGNTSKVLSAVGGVGLNVAFLKFGRDDEYQADLLGAEIMASAGYNPVAMANFFELLRAEQGRNPGKLETFMSSHPASADREARIRTQAASLSVAPSREVGGFAGLKTTLRRLPAAPTAPGQSVAAGSSTGSSAGTSPQDDGRYDVNVQAPSTRFLEFGQRNGLFTISYPDNWRSYGADSGYAVSFAPEGGVVDTASGQQAMLYGVIVNHYAPFESDADRRTGSTTRSYAPFEDTEQWNGSLEDATDDLVRQLIRSNSYLRAQEGQARRELIDGAASYSVILSGLSPVTGQNERVTVVTRGLSDSHVLYALSIVPGNGNDAMTQAFTRMLRSMTVNDEAAHRGTGLGFAKP